MPVPSGPLPTREVTCSLLRGFLLSILPNGVEVIIAQANRVPEPTGPDYVLVTWIGLRRLATTVDTWDMAPAPAPAPTQMAHGQSVAADIQLDVFGAQSTDNVNLITTLLRSTYGYDFFAPGDSGIAPLTCDDGFQMGFTNDQQQWEDRWVLKPSFELSVQVATTQQFADTVALTLKAPADALTP